jgi:hypothetical protein
MALRALKRRITNTLYDAMIGDARRRTRSPQIAVDDQRNRGGLFPDRCP